MQKDVDSSNVSVFSVSVNWNLTLFKNVINLTEK